MISFDDIFTVGGIFCCFITSIILFFSSNPERAYVNKLLGVILFSLGWYALMYLLVMSELINEVPYLYRTGGPLYYLMPPFSFFYIRSMVKREKGFRKYDWLHFIPAILAFIDLTPYYLSDAETKAREVAAIVNEINNSYKLAAGFLPSIIHFELRPVQGIIYLIFQWVLLVNVLKNKEHYHSLARDVSIRRLVLFTVLGTLLYLGLAAVTVKGYLNLASPVNLFNESRNSLVIMSITFFVISSSLFFRPEILYGIRPGTREEGPVKEHPKPDVGDNKPEVKKEIFGLDEEQMQMYAEQIESYLREYPAFRNKGITLNDLAVRLDMSSRNLSQILNQYYKQRFTDFINGYRVNYIMERFRLGNWRDLSLEGLALEAGFSSRSTFFAAFKKNTGLSPTEYLVQLKEPVNA